MDDDANSSSSRVVAGADIYFFVDHFELLLGLTALLSIIESPRATASFPRWRPFARRTSLKPTVQSTFPLRSRFRRETRISRRFAFDSSRLLKLEVSLERLTDRTLYLRIFRRRKPKAQFFGRRLLRCLELEPHRSIRSRGTHSSSFLPRTLC